MSKHMKHRRRGGALVPIVVVCVIVFLAAFFILPQIQAAREKARGNTCRNNMRGVGTALFAYQSQFGAYPGYINVLPTTAKKPQVDAATGRPVPVSWAVMILPLLMQDAEFEQWRKPGGAPTGGVFPSAAIFQCMSDKRPLGPTLSYVVNTGMPDADPAELDRLDPELKMPRDWLANGLLFDHFSDDPRIKPDPQPRRPIVQVGGFSVEDPDERTILLTENVDAGEYVFLGQRDAAHGWQAAEIRTGCIWRPGKMTGGNFPEMTPPEPSLQINVDAGGGDQKSYGYCRPSSRHPRSVNITFAGINTMAVSEQISYFVYAKLMASDDANIALPGQMPATDGNDPYRSFRTYKLAQEDFDP